MIRAPSLLTLVAGAAGLSIVAHGAALSAPAAEPQSRMGVSIQQSMSERDRAAARRNRALDLREQAARATEERLKTDLESRQTAEAQPSKGAEPAEDPYDNLARIYQTMKPAKAARVFEQLELDVQVQVAQRMRDRSTAMLLAAMKPEAAAKLSMAMADRPAPPGR